MIEYRQENTAEAIDDLAELVFKHAAETDIYQEYFKLDPDFDQYKQFVEMGIYRVFTARDKGELIGYTCFYVGANPHYKSIVYATNDILYVLPAYRDSGKAEVIRSLFSLAEEELKQEGVEVITLNMKSHLPFEKLAEYMGYDKAEIMYSKYLLGDK
tara:strand:+ start:412 stop:882 length:471 start_codon:yes stop_codon:yes gene_type:complete